MLEGTKILRETWCENELVHLYDNEDSVCGIIYNNTPFYFHKNLQGDIIAIADSNANIVARYTYDAWGIPTIVQDDVLKAYDDYGNVSDYNIGAINPFRYRSYYYDTEIGMYYLQSRYYNPVIGRFLNADEVKFIDCTFNLISNNIFSYCENNPSNGKDMYGKWFLKVVCAVAGGAIFGAFAYFLTDLFGLSGDLKKGVIATFATIGAALGAVFGPKLLINAFNKIKPWLKEMRRKTKVIKPNPKNPENLGGFVLLGAIKVMLHLPHLKNPQNPHKYLHLQIELGKLKFRVRLGKNVK